MNLQEKIVTITGGNGFLGTHVCDVLTRRGLRSGGIVGTQPKTPEPGTFTICRSAQFDLTNEKDVKNYIENADPNIIIHLAANVGGIGINREKPGTFYYNNLMMGALLIEHARRKRIEKFVAIGTVCSYPKYTPIPFKEDEIWNGFPEETNAAYGIAKKAMLVQAQAYRQEFNFNTIFLIPVNLYGPGDNFNPQSSHVIPALIKKCIDARDNHLSHITCWGTGTATREFLYVKDAAEAIVLATEQYDDINPINIGAGTEIPIKELVETIAKLAKFTGSIQWDPTCPDGQPRRCLNVESAKQFGFTAKTKLEDGLAETIEWYERSKK